MPKKGASSRDEIFKASTQTLDELERNVAESQERSLPEQGETYRQESSRHKRTSHNLPDFKLPPLGYSSSKKYFALYPELHLPALHPAGDLGTVSFGADHLPPNELYLGDNLQVLRSLPSKSIDLIYIDPPFFSGRNYNLIWGDDNELRTFGDIWEDGLPSYLEWLNARLWEMARVLKDTGSIFVHCDWHASHYIKTEMDKIFGYENFRNEVVWSYGAGGVAKNFFPRKHDVLLGYSKGKKPFFQTEGPILRVPYGESTLAMHYKNVDEKGRKYRVQVKNGKEYITYADEGKLVTDTWTDIGGQEATSPISSEYIGYPTQKPERILERIITAASRPGDVVADFFVGGGTTCAVAQRLGRRFVGADVSNVAFDVTRGRLVRGGEELSGVKHNPDGDDRMIQGKMMTTEVPSIRFKYVGIYPMQLFADLEQEEFKKFILTIVRARPSGTQDGITGYASGAGNQPILVGNVDTKSPIEPEQLKRFVEDSVKKYNQNLPVTARVFAWHFPATIEAYAKELQRAVDSLVRAAPFVIELIPIDSPSFRNHVLQLYSDVQDTALLLAFVRDPVIATIVPTHLGGNRWSFEAKGAQAWNPQDRLVNCQWDFDYQSGHFNADRGAVLMREKENDSWRASFVVEYEFAKPGKYIVACKVQDSIGGEAVESVAIDVK